MVALQRSETVDLVVHATRSSYCPGCRCLPPTGTLVQNDHHAFRISPVPKFQQTENLCSSRPGTGLPPETHAHTRNIVQLNAGMYLMAATHFFLFLGAKAPYPGYLEGWRFISHTVSFTVTLDVNMPSISDSSPCPEARSRVARPASVMVRDQLLGSGFLANSMVLHWMNTSAS